jgi:transposase
MAAAAGLSNATVARIWRAFGIKPHLVETFKLSTDPRFVEKLRDVVGLYLNPPEHAMVLCVDEKSQIQALDRTQPILPLRPGYAERHTHDYIRHGTATLFAALSIADGKVIGSVMKRHRHQEFIRFLEEIDRSTPKRLDLHLVLDNYGTHTHPAVYQWLARHRRFHFHFVPTSSSWLNQVERWFSELTEKRIRRGTFRSVRALVAALEAWIRQYNKASEPFRWTAKPSDILAKIALSQEALVTGH